MVFSIFHFLKHYLINKWGRKESMGNDARGERDSGRNDPDSIILSIAKICPFLNQWFVNKKSLRIPYGVIRSRKSKKVIKWPKKGNGTNNDIQNTSGKTKDWEKRTLLKTDGELGCSRSVDSSCSNKTWYCPWWIYFLRLIDFYIYRIKSNYLCHINISSLRLINYLR
jgi:hypothetical protein